MTTTNPAHGLRAAGYKDIFKDYPDIKVVAEVDEKSDPAVWLDRCHAVAPGTA